MGGQPPPRFAAKKVPLPRLAATRLGSLSPLAGRGSGQGLGSPAALPVLPFYLRYSDTRNNLNSVIRSFKDVAAARLFADEDVPRFRAIERQARRKLLLLSAAASLDDLRSPPGNRLEALKGDRRGQHSIRINDQWRICFVWRDNGAENVEIVDYH